MAKKDSLDAIINRAWESFQKNWVSFVAALLLASVIEGGLILIGLVPIIAAIVSMSASGIASPEIFSTLLANWESLAFSISFAAIFFTLAVLIGVALRGGLVAMTVQALKKKKTTYHTMFTAAQKQWKTFMGIGVITGLITIAIMAVLLGPGFFLLLSGNTVAGAIAMLGGIVIFLPVALILSVFFAFVYVAAVVHKLGTIDSIKTSIRFGMKNFGITLLLLIIFAVLSVAVAMLNMVTYILGTLLVNFVVVPLQLLSLTALYLGRKKGRR